MYLCLCVGVLGLHILCYLAMFFVPTYFLNVSVYPQCIPRITQLRVITMYLRIPSCTG